MEIGQLESNLPQGHICCKEISGLTTCKILGLLPFKRFVASELHLGKNNRNPTKDTFSEEGAKRQSEVN